MKTSTHKITAKNPDLELKALLQADLRRFKEVKIKNNQANGPLMAA